MSGYWWGLLTLPLGVAVVALMYVTAKSAYFIAGRLGRWGIIRFGKVTNDRRYRFGGIVADARHLVIVNKGTTGMIFFHGNRGRGPRYTGRIPVYEQALHDADVPSLSDLGMPEVDR